MSSSSVNFVRMQGFREAEAGRCELHYPRLMVQPRLVGSIVLVAVLLQSAELFLLLSALLWWNVAFPQWNPIELVYNRTYAWRRGRPPIPPAPPPRRFAQGVAATVMTLTGLTLIAGWLAAAIVLQVILIAALCALIFGRFCLGSYLYHRLRGEKEFANHTLPWSRST